MKGTVGFIGLGIMGKPMALNLLRKGFSLYVYNRTREKAKEVVAAGAKESASPEEVGAHAETVITMLTDAPDVEEVLLGPKGVIRSAKPGQVIIDMSTIPPEAVRALSKTFAERGVEVMDAPVSGGQSGAVQGTLTIMVGGKKETFERCLPVLQAMGSRITHTGAPGCGQVLKACNQILCAVNQIAIAEALSLCHRTGIDLDTMHHALTGGAGNSWAFEHLGKKVIEGDRKPSFKIHLMQKDLEIVLSAAKRLNLPLPGTALAQALFRAVQAEEGGGELGIEAMIRAYERMGNFTLRD